MSNLIICLLLWYGMAFGFQNKIVFLHDRFAWLARFLQCSFCVGFHVGWISHLLIHLPLFVSVAVDPVVVLTELVTWAFAAAGWCYGVDVTLQAVESYVGSHHQE